MPIAYENLEIHFILMLYLFLKHKELVHLGMGVIFLYFKKFPYRGSLKIIQLDVALIHVSPPTHMDIAL